MFAGDDEREKISLSLDLLQNTILTGRERQAHRTVRGVMSTAAESVGKQKCKCKRHNERERETGPMEKKRHKEDMKMDATLRPSHSG